MKAGHLSSQHEEEFVKQIKNILSSTKKYNSAESATTSVTKDGKVAAPSVQEPADVKVTHLLEGKLDPPSTVATTAIAMATTSGPAPSILPVTSGTPSELVVLASTQPSSQPSSQPTSPPYEGVPMSLSDVVTTTSSGVLTTSSSSSSSTPEQQRAHGQDAHSDAGGMASTGAAVVTVAAGSVSDSVGSAAGRSTGRAMYSQAVINGAVKSVGSASTTAAPSVSQSGSSSSGAVAATCNVVASLETCPLADHTHSSETSDMAPPKRRKMFEVETVNEVDSPSPDTSEMSAHSSMENLSLDTKSIDHEHLHNHTHFATEAESGRNLPGAGVGVNPPLESKSDSYISIRRLVGGVGGGGSADFVVGPSSNPPESLPSSTTAAYHQPLVPHFTVAQPTGELQGPQTIATPHQIQNSSEAMLKNRSISIGAAHPDLYGGNAPEYYHYNTAPHTHDIDARRPLSGDTFTPPVTHTYHAHTRYLPPQARADLSNAQHHLPRVQQSLSDPEGRQGVYTAPTGHRQPDEPVFKDHQTRLPTTEKQRKPSPARALTIRDFPQAELLSQAFMQFMYSMSTVFRDPTYQPLINSLDEHFSPQLAQPSSAPPNMPVKPVEQEEANVLRRNTEPVIADKKGDDHLKNIMMK